MMMNEEETTKKIKFPTLARKRMKKQNEHQNTNIHAYKTMMEHSNHEIQENVVCARVKVPNPKPLDFCGIV
jgi:hypothetical protein